MTTSRLIIPKMRNVSNTVCAENQNTLFISNNFFPPRKSCRLWVNVEKCGGAREAANDNMVARCTQH
jgi:hypothetical protein